ncbi:MAG: hypothetical protein AB7F36_00700 [Reyranellaceae bacterium]
MDGQKGPFRFGRAGLAAAIIAVAPAIMASPSATAQPRQPDEWPAASSCHVDVTPILTPGMTLDISVSCAVPAPLTLRASDGSMARHVVEVKNGEGKTVEAEFRDWTVAPDDDGIARLNYRFDLDAYLEGTGRVSSGLRRGDSRLVLLEGWLMQPLSGGLALPVAIKVLQTPGARFATGLKFSGGRWRLGEVPVRFAGYTVFGGFEMTSVPVAPPGSLAPASGAGSAPPQPASIDLVFVDGEVSAARHQIADWVRQSAVAVANFFDGYSASHSLIVVVPTVGAGVPYGRVVPGGGISMVIMLGSSATARELYGEWVLIHEMIHTASPFVYGRGTWLMEGMATLLEPVIRHRAGWKTEADVWREWILNMDRGHDALTVTGLRGGGSPYWGGALFLLLADIQIRRATGLRLGLEDCLRSILAGGGNAVERWSVQQMLGACDQAIGKPVMAGLAERFVDGATPFDLDTLWRDLGVELRAGNVVYDDKAPLAAIRKLIVRGAPARRGPPVPMGRT